MSSPSFSAKSVARVNSKIGEKFFFSSPRGALTPLLFSLIFQDSPDRLRRKDGTAHGLKWT